MNSYACNATASSASGVFSMLQLLPRPGRLSAAMLRHGTMSMARVACVHLLTRRDEVTTCRCFMALSQPLTQADAAARALCTSQRRDLLALVGVLPQLQRREVAV
jgi:hypothetical protein